MLLGMRAQSVSSGSMSSSALVWGAGNGLMWGTDNYITWGV